MVNINRGDDRRQVEEPELETMTTAQKETAVKEVLEEMDAELTTARHSHNTKIEDVKSSVIQAYTDRIMDLVAES